MHRLLRFALALALVATEGGGSEPDAAPTTAAPAGRGEFATFDRPPDGLD